MKSKNPLPSQQELFELFKCEKELGILYWKVRLSPTTNIGCRAGAPRNGRRGAVMIRGRTYYTTNIIWKIVTGLDPDEVDHQDGDCTNDEWSNLRDATHSQNMYNKKNQKNSRSGVKGVAGPYPDGKFRAQIKIEGKHISLGSYPTLEEAKIAYANGSKKYHGEFGRLA